MNAAVLEEPSEREIVIERRDETGRAGRKRRRLGPHARGGHRVLLDLSGLEIGLVMTWHPAALLGSDFEPRLVHPERLEDARPEEVRQGLTRGARDEDAQHERAGVVLPPFAWLILEGQGPEALDPLVA